jgi:hypothetical protein
VSDSVESTGNGKGDGPRRPIARPVRSRYDVETPARRRYELNRDLAIDALMLEGNAKAAAAKLGVPHGTLCHWMGYHDFQVEWRRVRQEMFKLLGARLQYKAMVAVDALVEICANASAPAMARVKAASEILTHGRYTIELEEVIARVQELERIALSGGSIAIETQAEEVEHVETEPQDFGEVTEPESPPTDDPLDLA